MASFLFLDNALANFLSAIQIAWADTIQLYGARILLMLVILALGINWLYAFSQRDIGRWLDSTVHSLISSGILYVIFLHANYWAAAILLTFEQIAQAITGLSPASLTPSGIIVSGITTCILFWKAAAHAMWMLAPMSAVEAFVCGIAVMLSFTGAAIIYLITIVEVWAVIIGGMLLLAFASLPWTAAILPLWALSVLRYSMKIFMLLAVLALGLTLAVGWATDMAANSGSISSNISLMLQAIVESLLFVACVYFLPTAVSNLVAGGQGSVMAVGEAMLGAAAAAGAGLAGSAAITAGKAATKAGVTAIAKSGSVGGQTVNAVRRMILA